MFDRLDKKRRDAQWLAAVRESKVFRYLVLDTDSHLVYPRGVQDISKFPLFSVDLLPSDLDNRAQGLFLGERDGELIFCFDIRVMGSKFIDMTETVDSRLVTQNLSSTDSSIFLMARGLNLWSETVQFCGRCGFATEKLTGGMSYRCGRTSCGTKHYPKIDPAVIMLVTDGGDQVALGRGHRHPEGMFSCFAGFLEPGESIEDAVVREVKEESGLHVEELHYFSSQAWPYPSAVMIGFIATARKSELELDSDEILEGRWFSRSELEIASEMKSQMLPRPGSLARQLLDRWLKNN